MNFRALVIGAAVTRENQCWCPDPFIVTLLIIDANICWRYENHMAIKYHAARRDKALAERGLDFEDAAVVFAGLTHTFADERQDYGEVRNITVGLLDGRMVIVGWTARGADRHVFSMRKANDREEAHYAPRLRQAGGANGPRQGGCACRAA